MDLARTTLTSQRATVYVAVVATALIFSTSAPDTFGLPKATVLWLAAVVLAALGIVRLAWDRVVQLPRSPWAVAVALFVVAVAVATLLSDTPALSVVGEYNRYTGLLSYTSFAVVGLVVLRTFDVKESATLLRVLAVLLGVVALHALIQDWFGDPFGIELGIGPVATHGNANLLAGYLGVASAGATWLALSGLSSRRVRIAAAAAVVAGAAAALASSSFQGPASVLVGCVAVVAVWATTPDGVRFRERVAERTRIPVRVQPVVAGLMMALAVLVALPALRSGLEGGLVERGDFWRAALSMFGDAPAVGTGFDTYGQHFLAERPVGHAVRFGFTQAESAHNVPLNLLAGGGLLVIIPYLAIVVLTGVALVRGLRRLDGEERLLLGGLGAAWLAYHAQSLVSFDVPQLGLLHFALAGAIVAIGTPPRWLSRTLPGTAARRARRGGMEAPAPTWAIIGLVVLVGLVASWNLSRPLRADLAAGRSPDRFAAGDIEGARAAAEDATALAPWQGRYWVVRAQVEEASQEVFAAVDAGVEAARRERGSSQYALLAGRLVEQYRDPADASVWFDEAIRRDPHNPEALAEVAEHYADIDIDEALELSERAIRISDTSVTVWFRRGTVLEEAGRTDDAVEAYERAVELSPVYRPALDALQRLTGEGVEG